MIRNVYYSVMESPVGPLLIAATEKGLRCVQFHRGKLPEPAPRELAEDELWIESRTHLQPYQEQLNAYFRGELREFTCTLDLIGTPFQKACWEALRRKRHAHRLRRRPGDQRKTSALGRSLVSAASAFKNAI